MFPRPTLPSGSTFSPRVFIANGATVTFDVVIDPALPASITLLSNQGVVSGDTVPGEVDGQFALLLGCLAEKGFHDESGAMAVSRHRFYKIVHMQKRLFVHLRCFG